MPIITYVLTALRGVAGVASDVVSSAAGFGWLIGDISQRIYNSGGVWAVYFLKLSTILIGATALFGYFSSFANILVNYMPSAGVASDIILAVGLIKPDNFAACFSIVISAKLFRIGLSLYFLVWNGFYSTASKAFAGK